MKIFSRLFLLLLLAGTTFYACMDDDDSLGPNETTELRIDFRGEFNGEPLAIQRETYAYADSQDVNLQLFQYYVSDLALIPAGGGPDVPLSEILLVRYNSALDDELDTRTFTVPGGAYSGLRLGLGVSPDLNAIDPNNFSANDPLNENEFWNANARYVFAKIEANTDLDADGTLESNLTLHMGADTLYRTLTLNQPFTLDGNGDPTLTVVADVFSTLAGYDIADPTQQRVHGGNQSATFGVWDRLADGFRLIVR